jgi:23S rRNA pseudouridine2605 synthase
MRLTRYLAQAGISSRRGADALVAEGQVLVNGEVVTEPWYEVQERDVVKVAGKGKVLPAKTVVYVLNKPKGYVCSRVQQGKAPIVTELLPASPQVVPVGRLDRESEGLLLLTNDGELAQKLMHPSFGHEREYEVVVRADTGTTLLPPEKVQSKLLAGVKLGDGRAKVTRMTILPLPNGTEYSLRLVVTEGRHHLVRRMCGSLNLHVRRLRRIRIGSLRLSGLASGTFKVLSQQDLSLLQRSVHHTPIPAASDATE